MEDIPPPPYSVTDSNSTSGSVQPRAPTLSTTTSSVDNASVRDYDATSSTGDPIIYTPPYTPDGDRSSHVESALDALENTSSLASVLVTSAMAYFESRPVSQFPSDVILSHTIFIAKDVNPSDISFPEPEKKWLERDVLPQDWETFVNYLIPHYTENSNQRVAERKLNAELVDDGMQRLTLDQNDLPRTDLQQVDAQLEPLRQSQAEESTYEDVKLVVSTWNEGFFKPRGLRITVSESQSDDTTRPMPGSWTDEPAEAASSSQWRASGCAPGRGFRRGLFQTDENGFPGRNMFSADQNGFRFANLFNPDRQGPQFGLFGGGARGFGFGRGNMHFPHHRGFHPERHAVHMPTDFRGRPPGRYPLHGESRRDRSHSISSSSSSGASSLESAGSLPDYDHLKDTQLPVAKQAIRDWLNHPDQPITKQTVKQIRQEIKAAKSGTCGVNGVDRDALKKEVRDLFKEFKAIKKSQQKAWKAAKRERKSLRREAKRNRKAARRDIRQADKEVKHADREARNAERKEARAGKMKEEAFDSRREAPPFTSENGYLGPANPQSDIPRPHMPFLPQMEPLFDGKSWPLFGNSQAANPARAAMLQAEGKRIEAEARREEALRKAGETRRNALDRASAARSRAEENRQEAEAKAASAHAKAQANAAQAREKAEQIRQRAEANANIARQKAEANRMLADAKRMLVDVNRMKIQAQQLSDGTRSRLLDVARELEEEAEKMKAEGENLIAVSVQSQKFFDSAFSSSDSPTQNERWGGGL